MLRCVCSTVITVTLAMGMTYADTRCVKLNAATVCTSSADCYNTSDCAVTCTGVTVNLAGRCSTNSGTENFTTAENLNLGTDNKFCWCAVVHPATSKWVLRYQYSDENNCLKNCARGCRNGFIFDNTDDINFRNTVHANLMG
ncbi:MAG: hypothetical protein K2L95_02350 [Alphaproteobacteria bacterium]|nr:hypothetical protein [Alphaproteobacteria bacterium]MDE6571037.1 hypothetical protein [Alphaproteobacteria bacterium]